MHPPIVRCGPDANNDYRRYQRQYRRDSGPPSRSRNDVGSVGESEAAHGTGWEESQRFLMKGGMCGTLFVLEAVIRIDHADYAGWQADDDEHETRHRNRGKSPNHRAPDWNGPADPGRFRTDW